MIFPVKAAVEVLLWYSRGSETRKLDHALSTVSGIVYFLTFCPWLFNYPMNLNAVNIYTAVLKLWARLLSRLHLKIQQQKNNDNLIYEEFGSKTPFKKK